MASKLRLQIALGKHPITWNPEKALADALAERALFLENYPKYKAFQKEIDKLMDKAGNPENRMAVLAVLMEAKLLELHQQFKQLNAILIRTTGQEHTQNRANRLISSEPSA